MLAMHVSTAVPNCLCKKTMPWTVSADTKGCKFPRWDQNTLAMGIQTEKPSCAASTDLQRLLHELGSPEPASPHPAPARGPAAAPPPAGLLRAPRNAGSTSSFASRCKGPGKWGVREIFKGSGRWRARAGGASCPTRAAWWGVQPWHRCHAVLPAPRPGRHLLFICLHPKSKRDREGWDAAGWSPCRRISGTIHASAPSQAPTTPTAAGGDSRENTNKTKRLKYFAFPLRISHACLVSGHPKKPKPHPKPFRSSR